MSWLREHRVVLPPGTGAIVLVRHSMGEVDVEIFHPDTGDRVPFTVVASPEDDALLICGEEIDASGALQHYTLDGHMLVLTKIKKDLA